MVRPLQFFLSLDYSKLEAQVSLYRSPDINEALLRISACRIHLSFTIQIP
jgi:hypothetical protein